MTKAATWVWPHHTTSILPLLQHKKWSNMIQHDPTYGDCVGDVALKFEHLHWSWWCLTLGDLRWFSCHELDPQKNSIAVGHVVAAAISGRSSTSEYPQESCNTWRSEWISQCEWADVQEIWIILDHIWKNSLYLLQPYCHDIINGWEGDSNYTVSIITPHFTITIAYVLIMMGNTTLIVIIRTGDRIISAGIWSHNHQVTYHTLLFDDMIITVQKIWFYQLNTTNNGTHTVAIINNTQQIKLVATTSAITRWSGCEHQRVPLTVNVGAMTLGHDKTYLADVTCGPATFEISIESSS